MLPDHTDNGIKRARLEAELASLGGEMSTSAVKRLLADLESTGRAEQVGGGRNTRWRKTGR